jgi:hypothetical protein
MTQRVNVIDRRQAVHDTLLSTHRIRNFLGSNLQGLFLCVTEAKGLSRAKDLRPGVAYVFWWVRASILAEPFAWTFGPGDGMPAGGSLQRKEVVNGQRQKEVARSLHLDDHLHDAGSEPLRVLVHPWKKRDLSGGSSGHRQPCRCPDSLIVSGASMSFPESAEIALFGSPDRPKKARRMLELSPSPWVTSWFVIWGLVVDPRDSC